MEAPKTIEHQIGGIQTDAFRFGLHGVKSNIIESHPLESAYKSAKEVQEDMKRKILANTYGSAFSLKMDLDRQILSRFQRPPGPIQSSMLGLEAVDGSLDDITFEDHLNNPRDSENIRVPDMHHGMEVRLGLSKGPLQDFAHGKCLETVFLVCGHMQIEVCELFLNSLSCHFLFVRPKMAFLFNVLPADAASVLLYDRWDGSMPETPLGEQERQISCYCSLSSGNHGNTHQTGVLASILMV